MSRHGKRKKQPHRNTLKKLRKAKQELESEKSEVFSLKKEQQLLNANIRREKETAAEASRNAIQREEQAQRFRKHTEEELRHQNKFHPTLMANEYIGDVVEPITIQDALRIRLLGPGVDWDDSRRQGAVRLNFGKQGGSPEQVAYGFSEKTFQTIDHMNNDVLEEAINSMGRSIARELLTIAKTKL